MTIWERAAAAVVRRRRGVLAGWALAAAALIPAARGVQDRLETNVRVDGSESARVDSLLTSEFATRFARYAVLVVRGLPPAQSDSGRVLLKSVLNDIAASPSVTGTLSALDATDSLFEGVSGGSYAIIGLDPSLRQDSTLTLLRARTEAMAARLSAGERHVELLWTGAGPLTVDLGRASADDVARAERRILPVTLALLVVAFGAIAAAILPLAAGALAIGIATGVVALLTHVFALSVLVVNVTTMLGLGLGIDYALLLVSRFREARTRGLDVASAATHAGAHAGESIVLSGGTVMLGFVGLLLVPLSDLRSIAVGGLLVTALSVLAATTLLPAVLAVWGGPVGRARRKGRQHWWARWSIRVVRRPVVVLAVSGLAVGALAWQSTRLERRMPSGDWLPPAMESARGVSALRAMGRDGVIQALRVVVEFPDGTTALSPDGWRLTKRVAAHIAADKRVARVRSLPSIVGTAEPPPTLLATAPGDMIATFVGRGARRAVIEVLPASTTSPRDVMGLVRDLRRDARRIGTAGARIYVGGLPAFNVDYEQAIVGATPRVVTLVVVGTLIALMIGFRSVMIPLKAVALNLATVAAAFGMVVLAFQDGRGVALLGLAAPLDGVFTAVPLLVFCIMFGLSMDYEVFLVARVAEAHRRGLSSAAAVVEGVRRTGGLITSAGLVMIAVFGAFVAGDFLLMKMLGFALASAVLLDITLVRLALGPALLVLAGRWNWWPGPVRLRRFGASVLRPVSVTPR